MKVAFYKGRKRIFNRLVSWWTRSPYSHVELILDNGLSVSSSFMDGGVRYKRIVFDPDLWDIIEIHAETPDIAAKINARYGDAYDWRGLIGFVIRPIKDDRNKMFCSEFLMHLIGYDETWRFDPGTTYPVIKKHSDELMRLRAEGAIQ